MELLRECLGAESGVRMARGQCTEHYGEGEPYLPILEALGQMCCGPGHAEVLAVLRRYAPLELLPAEAVAAYGSGRLGGRLLPP